MPRVLFEKKGNAVWISHLDLMRLFQRAFQRAGIRLTHSQGYHPRPSVSIALPLSVGMESECELMDFEQEGESLPCDEIRRRLNDTLVPGVTVREVYDGGRKIRELQLLRCAVMLEYDGGVPKGAIEALTALYAKDSLIVQKKSKGSVQEQDIAPMLRSVEISQCGDRELKLDALICCQNPALNPAQLSASIGAWLPEMKPDFSRCRRIEIFDGQGTVFR